MEVPVNNEHLCCAGTNLHAIVYNNILTLYLKAAIVTKNLICLGVQLLTA